MDFQLYKKMLRQWAFEQEPVFIVGPERSGTSLLFQQVSNHSAFCDFSHATVETFCFIKPWLLLEPAGPDNYEMRVYLGQKNLTAFQDSISPLVERNNQLTSLGMPLAFANDPNRDEIWFERRYKHILRAFVYHSSKHLGGKRFVEKTPAHIRCTSEIFETFPKAKVLICTRDISEIIASHKKRYQKEIALGKAKDDPSIAWLSHSVEQYANYLVTIESKIKELTSSFGDACKIVPYGQLTSNPNETLSRLFEFLGEETAGSVSSKERKQQAWDPLLNQAPQKNEVEIEKYLSKNEIKLINAKRSAFSDYWF
ncbi:sulfotransferase family protein [Alteromonas australica]|uniref:sulfotransferase family protein n=1 Tax=Alteromonas australica TaxID=589873 RepID=UPI0035C82471